MDIEFLDIDWRFYKIASHKSVYKTLRRMKAKNKVEQESRI